MTTELTEAALRQLTFRSNTVVISKALQREALSINCNEGTSLTVKCFQSENALSLMARQVNVMVIKCPL